eukprot:gnl/Carplike_NY0171/4053_a5487_252.p1 GENE.gnl/Carplike_NY0171/4053_a5487_252~~gnl/Carplike_NY0171/4053_a5487_252.p1  ORF type:complete len:724 (-),score=132.93 gnl/Carplike_NY0171/4053_a5487_252:80-2251(-)
MIILSVLPALESNITLELQVQDILTLSSAVDMYARMNIHFFDYIANEGDENDSELLWIHGNFLYTYSNMLSMAKLHNYYSKVRSVSDNIVSYLEGGIDAISLFEIIPQLSYTPQASLANSLKIDSAIDLNSETIEVSDFMSERSYDVPLCDFLYNIATRYTQLVECANDTLWDFKYSSSDDLESTSSTYMVPDAYMFLNDNVNFKSRGCMLGIVNSAEELRQLSIDAVMDLISIQLSSMGSPFSFMSESETNTYITTGICVFILILAGLTIFFFLIRPSLIRYHVGVLKLVEYFSDDHLKQLRLWIRERVKKIQKEKRGEDNLEARITSDFDQVDGSDPSQQEEDILNMIMEGSQEEGEVEEEKEEDEKDDRIESVLIDAQEESTEDPDVILRREVDGLTFEVLPCSARRYLFKHTCSTLVWSLFLSCFLFLCMYVCYILLRLAAQDGARSIIIASVAEFLALSQMNLNATVQVVSDDQQQMSNNLMNCAITLYGILPAVEIFFAMITEGGSTERIDQLIQLSSDATSALQDTDNSARTVDFLDIFNQSDIQEAFQFTDPWSAGMDDFIDILFTEGKCNRPLSSVTCPVSRYQEDLDHGLQSSTQIFISAMKSLIAQQVTAAYDPTDSTDYVSTTNSQYIFLQYTSERDIFAGFSLLLDDSLDKFNQTLNNQYILLIFTVVAVFLLFILYYFMYFVSSSSNIQLISKRYRFIHSQLSMGMTMK